MQLIQPGATVFLDGSTTAFQMTRLLRDMQNLTVITTGLYAALELSFAPDVTTIVAGGILRRRTSSLVDTLSPKLLRRLHVDIAFLSCRGFTAESGMMESDLREAQTKTADATKMLESKIGQQAASPAEERLEKLETSLATLAAAAKSDPDKTGRIPQLAALAGAIYVSETAARSAAYPFVRKFVVPNAIDTQAIQPAVEREKAVVYAGRFVASKGVLPMCAALAEALPRLPDWRLRIFAIHTSDEPETVATAQGMLAPLGDRAVWHTDASPAEVMAAMSRAAIAIAPSLAPEGFGRAVLEAMAGGAVVVAAPVAAFREVIGDSGVILPHVDQETIAGAVLELARNDAQRAAVAKAGRARAIAEFDIRASAKKLDAVFAAVTGGQAGTARPR